MNLTVAYEPITELLRNAYAEGRQFLYEYEVYNLLSLSGSETPPKCSFIPRNARLADEEVMAMPGDKAVLKIVSPTIIHKTEVGGVRIVPKTPDKVRSAVRRMLSEVPERYAEWIERHPSGAPKSYRGLEGAALQNAIASDLKGVLQVQFMPPDSEAFGNELIVGLRRTREFGMVISAGLGGTDTELYAERFRKGQAIIAALTAMTDGETFFRLFRQTVSYRKLAGLTRGQRRIITDDQLIECFESFIRMGNHFSPDNPDAPFVIDELEINPFAFTDYLMVPLDGMCKFSLPEKEPTARPVARIGNLLHPERIGIIGICGWGGMALNAATIDTRIKATVTSTMYDMSRVNANGYFDSMNADQRHELRRQLNEQRTIDTKNGSYALTGGVVDPLPDDVPWFVKDYHNYYKTDRGYHKRSLNSNGGWNKTSALSFINMPLLTYSDESRSAVLMIHGEKAHSRYFSEDAFKKLTGDNKELLILPGANHVDLYDNLSVIPFDKIEHFFHKYLK